MTAKLTKSCPIIDADGTEVGTLALRTRPRDSRPIECRDGRIWLCEQSQYLYEVTGVGTAPVEFDHTEIIDPDDSTGHRGRIRTSDYVGELELTLRRGGYFLGRATMEVRSTKLDYESHYRWMLEDIAREAAELSMMRFAPSAQRYKVDPEAGPQSLYQRFVLLRSLINSTEFRAALHHIQHAPHIGWRNDPEQRSPRRGLPARSKVVRQLGVPGPREPWMAHRSPASATIRRHVTVDVHEQTTDTPPNRFVRFAIEQWLTLITRLRDALNKQKRTAPVIRGLREIDDFQTELSSWIRQRPLRTASRLKRFPAGSTVLQKRPGYRQFFHTYQLVELGLALTWDTNLIKAGQRDVATLYEYWVYLQVARAMGKRDAVASLLVQTETGTRLKMGHGIFIESLVEADGVNLIIQLHFNRTFRQPHGSWSAELRPDVSLSILRQDDPILREPIWIHFDAKYRVQSVAHAFGAVTHGTRRDDLLKMHAYRDAIRRSAGAYVIYPGDKNQSTPEYHELLPGLGAFSLKPTAGGTAEGASALEGFLNAVCSHIASQGTAHERSVYWQQTAYHGAATTGFSRQVTLTRPAPDTVVITAAATADQEAETAVYFSIPARDIIGQMRRADRLLLTQSDGKSYLFQIGDWIYEETPEPGYRLALSDPQACLVSAKTLSLLTQPLDAVRWSELFVQDS